MTDEDKNFWKEYTKDVEKISVRKKDISEIPAVPQKRRNSECEFIFSKPISNPVSKPTKNICKKYAELTHGSSDNIDKRTAYRLKSGQMRIEERLDLHGHTQDEAYNALIKFVKSSFENKKRCVLIITGKGRKRSEQEEIGNRGVLKEMIPIWLNSPELRPYLLMFSYAKTIDGGEGALYVLLKA